AAGAGGAHRVVRIAEADRNPDQRLRADAIVAAEGAAGDALLGRRTRRPAIGIEPLRAAERRAPGAPVGGRLAGLGAAGGASRLRALLRRLWLRGLPRRGAVGHERSELTAGHHRDRLPDAGVAARQHGQRLADLARRQAVKTG